MEISETRIETIKEYQKSQNIRLVDVFVISPVCVYAGVAYRKILPPWLSISLVAIGIATAFYNGKNFLINTTLNNKVNDKIPPGK